MILVSPLAWFEPWPRKLELYKKIEGAGRTCYKSEDRITDDSCIEFVKMLKKRGHLSVFEHASLTARIICDRGVSHELVRHRIASYSQESTRYCNYGKQDHVKFVAPDWLLNRDVESSLINVPISSFLDIPKRWGDDKKILGFIGICLASEEYYQNAISYGSTPQEARAGLINALKTEIVVTANLREWLLIFEQRLSTAAHPDMRRVMKKLYKEFESEYPEICEQ